MTALPAQSRLYIMVARSSIPAFGSPNCADASSEVPPGGGDSCGLKRKPQAQLDLSLRNDGAGDHAGQRISDSRIRIAELRMIEGVESLGAECQANAFPDGELPVYSKIEVHTTRAMQRIAGRISKCILGRRDEGCGVEPMVDGPPVVRQIA